MAARYFRVMSVIPSVAPTVSSLGIEVKELFVLAAVEEHPYPAELAARLHMPEQTVIVYLKRLEAAGFVVRHHDLCHAAEVRERPLVRGDEVHHPLRRGRLRKRVVRRAEHGDEELDVDHLARARTTIFPVPRSFARSRLVGNLRVNVFRITDAAGDWNGLRWVATNEFTLENRRDWPASFGFTLDEGTRREGPRPPARIALGGHALLSWRSLPISRG